MMINVLTKIIENKKIEVLLRQQATPLDTFFNNITQSNRSFSLALSNPYADFILECKKASPSKGLIRANFNIIEIIENYKDFASAISVLTDEKYFQGSFDYLKIASKQTELPILCKDFFIEPYQVYEARYYGADAILLMLSVLSDEQYQQLAQIAESLKLDVLTEIHNQSELERALKLNAKIIGINNRDLTDLSIDLKTTEFLAKQIPSDRIIISESGINTHQDVKRLAGLVNGFLIGSSIMSKADMRSQMKNLIYGKVKICGITRLQDALSVDINGADYAGFVFYPKSKRYISLEKAKAITSRVALKYVGVFVDEPINEIVNYAEKLNLYAVQLHGNESDETISNLKKRLPHTQIWKAIHIKEQIQFKQNPLIDRYLLDTYSESEQGGTGQSFDWDLLDTFDTNQIIIAGGIDNNNIKQALAHKAFAIDLSSGVEISPGIKCSEKISTLFKQCRA